MIRRLPHRLSGRLPVRIIQVQGAPYLERYLLADVPGGGCLYLHRFLSSDPDRGYHNHPWRSWSLILAGGYIEHRWISGGEVAVRITPGQVNRITPERYHRVELLGPEAWSLFYRAGRAHPWGFLSPIPWTGPVPCYDAEPGGPPSGWVYVPAEEATDQTGFWNTCPKGRDSPREGYRP